MMLPRMLSSSLATLAALSGVSMLFATEQDRLIGDLPP